MNLFHTILATSTLGLALVACSSSSGDDAAQSDQALGGNCYHAQTLRAVYPLTTCPNEEKNGALCYPFCRAGYHGAGPYCWQDCPPGYNDDGATCRRDASIISSDNSACPWYDKCGLVSAKGCSTCPAGYANDGCTCRKDADIFGKSSYYRGLGDAMSCAPGQERIGALCYGNCDAGWTASGIYCNQTKVTCTRTPPPEAQCPSGETLRAYAFCLENPEEQIAHECGEMIEADVNACNEDDAKKAAHNRAINWNITAGACPSCQFAP
jgi:hypothetical protein